MTTPVPLADLFAQEDFFALLEVSLTGINLLRPVYAPDGSTITDFAIAYLNPAGQRMTGLSEQPGGTLLGRFPHALAGGIFQYYQRVFETGEQLTYHTNYQADGLDNFFQFRARRSGAHLLVSFTDTSDQNRSAVELALRESQAQAQAETEVQRQRLHQLVTEAPALIASLRGPEHVVELANEGFRAIFGGREMVGKTYREAVPELEGQPFFGLLDEVYRTGETYYGIDQPVTLDRTNSGQLADIFVTFTYQATRDVQGHIDGILIFAYEVTEQVLARQERDAQRQHLRDVFEQAPVAIFVLRGLEYVFEVVNPSMAEIIGSPPEQILGQRYFDLLPTLVEQGYPELVAQVWHSGQAYVAQEQAARLPRHGEGETGYYNFTYVPLRDAEEITTGIMCVAVDVTPQVLARQQVQSLNQELAAINEELTATNEELNESNTQLTRTNVDLDTFVYMASHDLKAPITNIESITLALRDTLPAAVQQDEMIARLLDLLEHTTTRFQATISQLTDLSKLQLAHAGPAESVNLAAAVESVRLDLVPVLTKANTHLTVEVAPDLLVSFSPANLRSAIYNLLSNAVKYRALDRPAQVRLRAFPAESRVVLEVQDNGLGMSAVQQRQLFGLFQRLHTHVEGTGVGLYITKRLVENGGGTIAVQSQVAVGTTFTLTFPT